MKRTIFILSLVLITAIALSACGPTTIVANPAPPQRTLNVTGTGTVNLTPDVAYINIGVHTERPTAAEAVAVNTDQTQQVVNALKNFGVDPKDIRTTNFSIWPNPQYDPQTPGKQIGTTYVVDNTVYVTFRQLDKLGNLLGKPEQTPAAVASRGFHDTASFGQDCPDERHLTEGHAGPPLSGGQVEEPGAADVHDGKGRPLGQPAERQGREPAERGEIDGGKDHPSDRSAVR